MREQASLIRALLCAIAVSGCAHPPPPEEPQRSAAPVTSDPGAAARLAATHSEILEHEPYLRSSRADRLTPGNTSKEPVARASRATLADEEIVSVAHLANRLALEQAQVAERRASDTRVRNLARVIARDARRAQAQTERMLRTRGLSPVPSWLAAQLQADAERHMAQLATKQGPEFDRAWIEAERSQRRETLRVIDDRLLPSSADARVVSMVRTLRNDLERRGTRAFQLKGDLDK
jgi:predicted outer membrane protein